MGAGQTDQIRRAQTLRRRVIGMDFAKRFGDVLVQPVRPRGAGHGVPLVAHPSGVQTERIGGRHPCRRGTRRQGQHPCPTVRGKELTIGEHTARAFARFGDGPTGRHQAVVFGVADPLQARDIEIAPVTRRQPRQHRIFAEHIGGTGEIEFCGPPHTATDIRHDIPIVARHTRRGQDAALTADGAVRIRDRPVLFRPTRRGQNYIGKLGRIRVAEHIRHHGEITVGNRIRHAARIGHRHGGVGAHDPQGLDPAIGNGVEHIDGLEARLRRHVGRAPEILNGVPMRLILQIKVTGQHICQTANLTSAHGVGLTGDTERAHAGAADPTGGKVTVQDRVDLIRTG